MAIGRAVRATYLKQIDQTQTPWQIDLQLDPNNVPVALVRATNAKNAAANVSFLAAGTMKGIFKLNGDRLEYCMALPGRPRPRDFTTPQGSAHTRVVLEVFHTGEAETEQALRNVGVRISKDEIGWITNVTINQSSYSSYTLSLHDALPI